MIMPFIDFFPFNIRTNPGSVQFSSVAQSCPTLCNPMNHSMPGLPVHHQLLKFIQTHMHWVSDAIQPSYPLSSPSPPTWILSQHQGVSKWVSSSHQVAKVLVFQLQHQSFQWGTSVQSLSRVRLFATPWTAACQASLSITNSRGLLKLMSIESVMPSNHLILCCPLLFCLQSFPASGSFPVSQFFTLGGRSIGASASASVLPMNIQDWYTLRLTGLISLPSKGLSRVPGSQFKAIGSSALSLYFFMVQIHTHNGTHCGHIHT